MKKVCATHKTSSLNTHDEFSQSPIRRRRQRRRQRSSTAAKRRTASAAGERRRRRRGVSDVRNFVLFCFVVWCALRACGREARRRRRNGDVRLVLSPTKCDTRTLARICWLLGQSCACFFVFAGDSCSRLAARVARSTKLEKANKLKDAGNVYYQNQDYDRAIDHYRGAIG